MADSDLYLRSDADKGETSPDKDLRLRSDADKSVTVSFVPYPNPRYVMASGMQVMSGGT